MNFDKLRNILKKRRYLVFLFLLLLLFLGISVFFYSRISYCEKNCNFSVNEGLESLVDGEGAFVTFDETDNNDEFVFAFSGRIVSSKEEDGVYKLILTDFFNQTQVDENYAEYEVTLSKTDCSSYCKDNMDELLDHGELTLNELVKIKVRYVKEDLSFGQKAAYYLKLFRGSFTDQPVNMAPFTEIEEFKYSFNNEEDIRRECKEEASFENLLSNLKKMRVTIVDVVDNYDESKTEGREDPLEEKFYNFGNIRCDSCKGDCYVSDFLTIGLDYVFIPMFDYTLLELEETEPPDTLSLDLLSFSYDSSGYDSFEDFYKNEEGELHKTHVLWGSEPVCMPYLLGRKNLSSDINGELISFYKKLCYGQGEKEIRTLKDIDYDTNPFTDEVFFEYADVIFSDLEATPELEHFKDFTPNDAFIDLGMDNYIFGYETENELLIRLGNERVILTLWDMVARNGEFGKDTVSSRYHFRKILTALIIKRQLTEDPEVKGRIDELIEEIVDMVGGKEYVDQVYSTDNSWQFPATDVNEKYQMGLSDILLLQLLSPEDYDAFISDPINRRIDDWFYYRYMSSACGKQDRGLMFQSNTDGECMRYSINIRKNMTTGIYLLIMKHSLNAE